VKDTVEWAPGPRADEALMLCSEARALLRGDLAPSRTDLHSILDPVMKLRMALKWNAGAEWNNVLNAMKGPK
jgi:MoxR-like ATPase